MDKAAALLLAKCSAQGLLQPGGFLPVQLSGRLDAEGELEEYGLQLCGALGALGESHFRSLD
eukprot:100385-Chlamydomonas_euryale.AAC.1